jgi:hypothetical protein
MLRSLELRHSRAISLVPVVNHFVRHVVPFLTLTLLFRMQTSAAEDVIDLRYNSQMERTVYGRRAGL